MEFFPSYGGATFLKNSKKMIRLILKGCTNRPFFHISVQEAIKEPAEPVIEQIGNYDPLPNAFNEKLVSINFHRLEYWLRQGAVPTVPVLKLLGLSGYFPVHPDSLRDAFLRRKRINQELENLRSVAAQFSSEVSSESSDSVTSSSKSDLTESEKENIPSEKSSDPPETKS